MHAIAVQHVPFENLGNLAPVLTEFNYSIEYLTASVDDLNIINTNPPDLLIILGGPINANSEHYYPFLQNEISVIHKRLQKKLPTLGICLGAQLIVKALGANVFANEDLEIGWQDLKLTAAGEKSILKDLAGVKVLHWHGDTYNLPDNAVNLASTTTCKQQAFVIDNYCLALQFHLEATISMLEQWYVGHTAELSRHEIKVPDLRSDTARFEPILQAKAIRLWKNWLTGLN